MDFKFCEDHGPHIEPRCPRCKLPAKSQVVVTESMLPPGCEICRNQELRSGWDVNGKWARYSAPPPGWVRGDHYPDDRAHDYPCVCNPEAAGAIRT